LSEETLAFTDDGIEIPDGVDLSDGVVFRARGVTVDHKPGMPDRSFYPAVDERHLQEEQEGIQNDHLDAYEVSIKPYGEEAETYQVVMPATDGGQYLLEVTVHDQGSKTEFELGEPTAVRLADMLDAGVDAHENYQCTNNEHSIAHTIADTIEEAADGDDSPEGWDR